MWRWFGTCNCFCSSSAPPCECDHGYQYTFTLAGLSGGAGNTCCALFNRTWTMSWVTNNDWNEVVVPSTNPCTISSINRDRLRAQMSLFPLNCGGQLDLQTRVVANYINVARYTAAADAFDCETGGTFSLSSSPACSGWPSSIHVTKV